MKHHHKQTQDSGSLAKKSSARDGTLRPMRPGPVIITEAYRNMVSDHWCLPKSQPSELVQFYPDNYKNRFFWPFVDPNHKFMTICWPNCEFLVDPAILLVPSFWWYCCNPKGSAAPWVLRRSPRHTSQTKTLTHDHEISWVPKKKRDISKVSIHTSLSHHWYTLFISFAFKCLYTWKYHICSRPEHIWTPPPKIEANKTPRSLPCMEQRFQQFQRSMPWPNL